MEADDADHLWEPMPPPPPARNNNNDEAPPPEVVEEVNRNADGSLDGGMAVSHGDENRSRRSSMDCDLVLFVECTEKIDGVPDHPVLQPGVTVSIGLEKSTKLSAVFERYCAFCNENGSPSVQPSDVEFVHCTLLRGSDTAESSALMKNDRIRVRRVRSNEREAEAERRRVQRESDKDYFRKLRGLLPDMVGAKGCDVQFDCRGKLVDENGLNQKVLRTFVPAHSALLSRRCPWLGRIVQTVRDEHNRRSVITIPDNDGTGAAESDRESPVAAEMGQVVADSISPNPQNPAAAEEDEDDGFEVLQYRIDAGRPDAGDRVVNDDNTRGGSAAQIENDEDDDNSLSLPEAPDGMDDEDRSPVMAGTSGSSNMLWVVLPNHPPEAVKLLLEYCYTNRVLPLGQDAFVESCNTRPEASSWLKGPVSPFLCTLHGSRTMWPNNGLPLISFPVALAGISLAEEASMPRLSLMCEVAAAVLVTRSNFVEALSICSTQQQRTGNNLPRLREAAMDVVLRYGERGVVEVCRMSNFRKALKERSDAVVPSLLVGTMEALTPRSKKQSSGSKREIATSSARKRHFDMLDREDSRRRALERRQRRSERRHDRGEPDDEEDTMMFSPYAASLTLEPGRTSLKRVSQHLETLARSDANLLGYHAILGRRRSRSGGNKASSRRRSSRSKGS